MAFREVGVVEIKEILRLRLQGRGQRKIAELTLVDRKTVRRYLEAAEKAEFRAEGGEAQITDELIGKLVDAVRPVRPQGHGESWDLLLAHREFLKQQLDRDLRLTTVRKVLRRKKGVEVTYPTLRRFCVHVLGWGRKRLTVRVADCEPGSELQVDFGRMGLVPDPGTGRRRMLWALIFTAVYSRHQFVFLSHSQALPSVIEGFEAAWAFFGGVFAVVIPDNMKAIVEQADALDPRLNAAFQEYAQSRGFVVDPARIRKATDKPRVERNVPFVRDSFFRAEEFRDRDDAQAKVETWCLSEAGLRIHGTTQLRPLEVFLAEEAPVLAPAPEQPYELPIYARPKVARDFHIEVDRALYSVPHTLVGQRVDVRADSRLVKVFWRGQLVKCYPRCARGGRVSDPADFPEERRGYAFRDIEHLKRAAASNGPHIGIYASRLLDSPLPWTRMRRVYHLLHLVNKHTASRVEEACRAALELDVVDVTRIARMLDRNVQPEADQPVQAVVLPLRFAREASEFALGEGGDVR